jgi:hypothetical protein
MRTARARAAPFPTDRLPRTAMRVLDQPLDDVAKDGLAAVHDVPEGGKLEVAELHHVCLCRCAVDAAGCEASVVAGLIYMRREDSENAGLFCRGLLLLGFLARHFWR